MNIHWAAAFTGACGVAAVLVLWWLAAQLEPGRRRPSVDRPWRLFFALCRAHRLAWFDRWLLWRLARRQRLEDPARLFLEPERLTPDDDALAEKHAGRLAALGKRLFA